MRNKSVISSYLRIAFILAAMLFCFQSSSYAADITLKWAANTEPDLAGYKIYYKNGFSGAPYDGVDIDQGTSPISLTTHDPNDPNYVDPNDPELLLTGLEDNEDYFFVVTAYDNEEPYNESGFSNEVNTLSGSSGDSGVVGDSGGESSCFIASSVLSSRIDCLENHFGCLRKIEKYVLVNVAGSVYLIFFIYPFVLTACIIKKKPDGKTVGPAAIIRKNTTSI
jgi:hypothetical protein